MTQSTQILSTTETSIEIIETIEEYGRATPEQIAQEANLSTSTVYKHIATLIEHGFLNHKDGTYSLGGRLFSLGMSARNHNKIYEIAENHTYTLAMRSNMESEFGVEENGRLISLYNISPNNPRSSLRTEYYQYLHTTAMGKAILATFTDTQIDQVIDQWGLPKQTEHSISVEEELFEELETVRERGYAINAQESRSGKLVVGKAIDCPSLDLVGAFCISGPKYQITEINLHNEFPSLIRETVDDFKSDIDEIL